MIARWTKGVTFVSPFINVNMANAIKTVPVLKEEVAISFNEKAKAAASKKSSVKFGKQAAISAKILAKAKI